MNSSPPPPSFTLPPANAAGKIQITPSPSVSPTDEQPSFLLDAGPSNSVKGKGRAEESHNVDEDGGRVSMYVVLFEEMIETVLASESYLFTPREIFILNAILQLPYDPKYLLTRLLLRRPGKIHPFSSIGPTYSPELGEDGVLRAAKALTSVLDIPEEIKSSEPIYSPPPKSSHKPAITPLQPSKAYPTPSTTSSKKPRGKRKPWSEIDTGLSAAEEKADPDLAEAIRESLWASKVGRVELDDEGTVLKTPPPERTTVSRSTSGGSSTSSRSGQIPLVNYSEEFTLVPTSPPPITALAKSYVDMSLDEIMSCVSAEELRKMARARKIPLSSLLNRDAVTTALRGLANKQTILGFTPVKGKKPSEKSVRQATLPLTPSKAVTTESLLVASLLPHLGHYAIRLTSELHDLIGRVNLIYTRTPPLTSTASSLMLPSILVSSHKRRYPGYGPPTRSRIWSTRDELLTWERAVHWESVVADALGETWAEQKKNPLPGYGPRKEMPGRIEGAKIVRRLWEGVWPIWKELVEGDKGFEVDVREQEGGLVGDRFKTGHVLTRIVYKSAVALGVLHEYDLECEVLKALLQQRRWRRSKRGAWYERLALVLMNHYNTTPEGKEEKMQEATEICIDGLLDEDTHLIYRPSLSRRLTRLENKLNLPAKERHISHAELLKCETRELSAPRVPENMGAPKMRPRADSTRDSREREASLGLGEEGLEKPAPLQQTGKSVWVGREGEVTVEGWVLEWWEAKGYKGYHSEGSILTTLFALLMWPVLFHPLPGAFETPYQTAPLDLGEDTFAPARATLIEPRLESMSKTSKALEMLQETDRREREKATWAVGLSWEYEKSDLEELVQCLGGKALSGICRMLAEEYRHRVSGVPDLIVWDYSKKEARFIEVKGPGDNLSETQKIWIDVLLSAGVPVEVCRVNAKSHEQSMKALERLNKKKKVEQTRATGAKRKAGVEDETELEVEVREDDPEQDEWEYESGGEGKDEGHWESAVPSKRTKTRA